MKKKVLIIVPFENIYPPTNEGMQRFFNIIHELAINFKLTLIISQSKEEFLKKVKDYQEIKKCEIYSVKDIKVVQTFSKILPPKLENALRYRWYKNRIKGPTDDNFLKLYQLLVRLLFHYKYNAIIITQTNLNFVNLVRKFDKEVAIIYDLDYQPHILRNSILKRWHIELLFKKVNVIINKKSIAGKKCWKIIDTPLVDYIETLPEINYHKGKFKIHFLTFASASFTKTMKRIQQEAERSGFFDTISCMKESDLPLHYRTENKSILNENTRGFGYWMWKSYITKLMLEKIDRGDILVYMDVGCSINIEGKKRFYEYIEMLINSKYSNLSFQLYQSEKKYSKGDLFKFFDIEKNETIKKSGQLFGGVFLIRKDSNSEKLVDQWYSICHNNKHLIDDSVSIYANDPSFIEHRHDQSIFSLLRKLNGSLIIKDETWFSNWNENKHLPIHATRLKNLIVFLK